MKLEMCRLSRDEIFHRPVLTVGEECESIFWWQIETQNISFTYKVSLFEIENIIVVFTQIIFDSLFGKELNGKLRVYAVQFVHHICLWSSEKVINMMGPVLLNGMTKLINEDKQVCIN